MVQKRSGTAFDRCADTKDAVWEWTRDDAKIIFPLFPPPATCCSGTRDQQARKSSLGNLTALGAKAMLSDRLFESLSSFLAAIFIF